MVVWEFFPLEVERDNLHKTKNIFIHTTFSVCVCILRYIVMLQGKIEMEMTLVPAEEADEKPVGKGRSPPSPLPAPK